MNYNKKEKVMHYITGLPVSAFPQPPKDWSKSFITVCPNCSEKMWITHKKIAYSKNVKNFKIICMVCCVVETQGNVDFIDINKVR